jgi:hypothetical protein
MAGSLNVWTEMLTVEVLRNINRYDAAQHHAWMALLTCRKIK